MPASMRRYDLLQWRLDRLTRMLPGVEAGDVRAVHRTRVASRRLREVLPILQLDGAAAEKLARRLRKLTRRLGRLRELDVLLLVIDELHESGRFAARALQRVGDDVRKGRDEARGSLSNKTAAVELRRVGRKLEAAAKELKDVDRRPAPRGRGWRWAIDARVAQRAARLDAAIEEAGAVYLPDRVHRVRIALKKLRYGVELSADAAGIKDSADLRTLKRGQELLGRLHDLQVLIERVRRVQAALTPPDVTAWRELDAIVTALEKSCRRLHARYVRDRATIINLCDRLGAKSVSPPRSATRRAG